MKQISIFFFLFLTLLFSCKKEQDDEIRYVTGKVFDGLTHQPVEGVNLYNEGRGGSQPLGNTLATTDLQGNFVFSFLCKKDLLDASQYIAPLRSGYGSYGYNFINIPTPTLVSNYNIVIYPTAYINLNVTRVATMDSLLVVKFSEGGWYYHSQEILFSNGHNTGTMTIKGQAGKSNSVFLSITHYNSIPPTSGTTEGLSYNIFCPSSDTVQYQIQL